MSTEVKPAHRVAIQAAAASCSCSSDTLGTPVRYYDGPYAGKVILTTIEEVQKADLGRQSRLSNHRPINPPAVVQVRLYEIKNRGTDSEEMVEMDVDAVHTLGLVCHAELYPYNPEFEQNPSLYTGSTPRPMPIQQNSGPIDCRQVLARRGVYPENLPRQPQVPLHRVCALTSHLSGQIYQSVVIADDFHRRQKKGMYFIFSELYVSMPGHFMLKYTAMSVDKSLERTGRAPLLAECWGGVFAIYPSKQNPSLKPSTELTMHLSCSGAKVHTKEKRRFQRRADPPVIQPGTAANDKNGGGDSPFSGISRTPTPAGPVTVAFIRDPALVASYDRKRDPDSDELPSLRVAIPERSAWAAPRMSRASAGLHREIPSEPDDGAGSGWDQHEMEVDPRREVLRWPCSNVRGD
ncbi:hypothetical protein AURDEDRAFT_177249 [Auricularia subglabra TFB-10046 SS5]|uniref:Velvet domain-containing protein n=1 Tax=Auricularia subglabra (strain TFB-10046 / SS5) TaxID=717982 RepID=J0WMS8_AURST|nr:hypothetical protein AURDEDRAFT_177249 [Auricularia subglabra TFB-10046 SS5]